MIRGINISSAAQLRALQRYDGIPERIYLPYPAFLGEDGELSALAEQIPAECEIFAALPFLTREEPGMLGIADIGRLIDEPSVRLDGVLVRNLETVGFLREKAYQGILETDQQIPVWNIGAAGTLADLFSGMRWEWTISPELSGREIRELLSAIRQKGTGNCCESAGLVVYGRAVMMVSVNCIRMTAGRCTGKRGGFHTFTEQMRDRKGKDLPVTGDCRVCYNIVQNAVPTSLHRYQKEIASLGIARTRIDLRTETDEEIRVILAAFDGCISDVEMAALGETTTGRFKTGVE